MKKQFWFELSVFLLIAMNLSGYTMAQTRHDGLGQVFINRTINNPDTGNTSQGYIPTKTDVAVDSESSEVGTNTGFFFVPLVGLGGDLGNPEFRYGGLIGFSRSDRGRVFAEYYGDGMNVSNILVGYEYPLKATRKISLVPSIAIGRVSKGYHMSVRNPILFFDFFNRRSSSRSTSKFGMGAGVALEFGLTETIAWRLNFQTMFSLTRGQVPDVGLCVGIVFKM
jgi:hypothetical protein